MTLILAMVLWKTAGCSTQIVPPTESSSAAVQQPSAAAFTRWGSAVEGVQVALARLGTWPNGEPRYWMAIRNSPNSKVALEHWYVQGELRVRDPSGTIVPPQADASLNVYQPGGFVLHDLGPSEMLAWPYPLRFSAVYPRLEWSQSRVFVMVTLPFIIEGKRQLLDVASLEI